MKMYLLRHGETEEGKQNIILGHLPGTLTEDGKEYARKAGELIKSLPLLPDVIVASDLKRAKDTAEVISQITKIPVQFDPLLRERKAGDAEGMDGKQIDWERYESGPRENRSHQNGESFAEVRKRAGDFLRKMPCDSEKSIVVVSHKVAISMILSSVLGWDYEKSLDFKFDNAVVLLDTKRKQVSLLPLTYKN